MNPNGRPPPRRRMPLRGPRGAGMGNPGEEPYMEQFRDSKSLPPDSLVYRAREEHKYTQQQLELKFVLEEMKWQFGEMLAEFVRLNPIFAKRPAYIEPPFFANPMSLMRQVDLAPVSAPIPFTDIISIPVRARHALILTGSGMDISSPLAVTNRDILWRFRFAGATVPDIIDQDTDIVAGFEQGVFSMPLGTFTAPFLMHPTASSVRLKATSDTNFILQAANRGAINPVTIRVLVATYMYRYDHASEFEQAELMQ